METKLETFSDSGKGSTDMAYPPGLVQHGTKWRMVKRIPQDLLAHYHPKEILYQPTGESDKKAAAAFGWAWLADIDAEFQRIRETGSLPWRLLWVTMLLWGRCSVQGFDLP